ncbi:hypothetical protein KQY30_03510 [Streptomyces sp. GMY02]|uniref:hypothetical protein n=1 Tax=Streptomyces sp. GMY02 TaxID=1333528 RepID=UPI001C2C1FCB|nr:hypothetical protein [Streptomyces sp. GMY02]QXE33493.1 hypothetical protein KQY30_03510 [Streptomyces sp. GMY02]
MPLPILILIAVAIGAAGVGAAIVVTFWDRILGWARTMFLPWVDKYLPELAEHARRAFMSIHGAVIEVRRTIREAWSALRTRLVRQLVEFTRRTNGQWFVKTTSWIIASLSPDENPQLTSHEVVQPLALEDVPSDVLERWMRHNESTISIDLTKVRDEEVMEMQVGEG